MRLVGGTAFALALVAAACGSDEAPRTRAARVQTPAPADPVLQEQPSQSIDSAAAAAAERAYRDHVAALERGDASEYLAGYHAPLVCFDTRVGVTVEQLRQRFRADGPRRVLIHEIVVASATHDRVVLGVRGREGAPGETLSFYSRLVRLVRVDGRWLVDALGDRGTACFDQITPVPLDDSPPLPAAEANDADALRILLGHWIGVFAGPDGALPPARERLLGSATRGIQWILVGESGRASSMCSLGANERVISNVELGPPWFSCNREATRCTAGPYVFLFRTALGAGRLAAVVEYEGERPAAEPEAVVQELASRDRVCELHDRLVAEDTSLVRDELWWVCEGGGCNPRDPDADSVHLCGAAAAGVARNAVRACPDACNETRCWTQYDGNSDASCHAIRDQVGLRLSVIAQFAIGANVADYVRGQTVESLSRPTCP